MIKYIQGRIEIYIHHKVDSLLSGFDKKIKEAQDDFNKDFSLKLKSLKESNDALLSEAGKIHEVKETTRDDLNRIAEEAKQEQGKILGELLESNKNVSVHSKEMLAFLDRQEMEFKKGYSDRLDRLADVNEKLDRELEAANRMRERAAEEQKRLWERLDILRDNLNSEQVWMKVWEAAFSKAFDMVWSIHKNQTIQLMDKVREEAVEEAKKQIIDQYDLKYKYMVEQNPAIFNMDLILGKREKANSDYLTVSRMKNDPSREVYLKGRVEVLDEVINEKK